MLIYKIVLRYNHYMCEIFYVNNIFINILVNYNIKLKQLTQFKLKSHLNNEHPLSLNHFIKFIYKYIFKHLKFKFYHTISYNSIKRYKYH